MGSRNWHLARAKRHKEVADFLAANSHDDWAVVALFYSALHQVHSALSGDPTLRKDERHPRKHTSPSGAAHGGRGTNQLVLALFPADVNRAYRSLVELGHRTRYDVAALGPTTYALACMQYSTVTAHCSQLNSSRQDISTQAP